MTTLEQSLLADIPRLTSDEQAALRYVLDRILVVGRASYSPWKAEGERRDMDVEIGDELADAIVYVGMRSVRRAVEAKERRAAVRHDEAFAKVGQAMTGLLDDNGKEVA